MKVPELKSKVAYLQGLSSGMNLNPETTEGKLFQSIIGVLEEFAESFDQLEKSHEELEDYLETVDQDLTTLEEEFYGRNKEVTDDAEYVEVECPNCGETVCFDADILEDDATVEIICPNCDEVVFVNDDNLQTADEPEALEGNMTAGVAGKTAAGLAGDEDI
ncbi:MAG: CD1247 N-terminal domain-containing protein [Bacillota bacterium]